MYADALAELGDPRGEFILLDCLVDATERQRRRASALLRHHHRSWLAGLEPLADTRWVRFDRGFLHTIGLRRAVECEGSVDPEAALVRELQVVDGGPREPDLTPVLLQLPGLRVARGLRMTEWGALRAELVELELVGAAGSFLTSTGRRRALRRLSLDLGVDVQLGHRVVEELDLEHLDVGRAPLAAWISLRTRIPSLTVRGRSWRWTLGGSGGVELTVDPSGTATLASRVSDLMATLRTLELGQFRWIWVRGGPPPGPRLVRDIRRAARGIPLRLPATWTRGDDET